MPRKKVDTSNTKLMDDMYEFLHLLELGCGSPEQLVSIFGSDDNKDQSNLRQLERIKKRCIALGIAVTFDDITGKFKAERNSKLIIDQLATSAPTYPRSKLRRFGPFRAAKVRHDSQANLSH